MRTTKPKSFSRPSVDLDRGEVRVWQHLPARKLRPGDTVAGFGLVSEVLVITTPEALLVSLTNEVTNARTSIAASVMVYAFTT